MTRSGISLFALLVFLSASGWVSPPPYAADTSQKAYTKAVQELERLSLPAQPYEDWKLFQDQDNLRALYLKLLKIDPNKAMQEINTGQLLYIRAFTRFSEERGITNNTGVLEAESREYQLHQEFDTLHRLDFTNTAAPLMIVWEMWAEFQSAEVYFRDRMIQIRVSPEDAVGALLLSDRHRRGIGQWEAKLCENAPPDSMKPDTQRLRDEAVGVLGSLVADASRTPLCRRLAVVAEEEIARSLQAEKAGRWCSALYWARDAVVTAGSAKAMYYLELEIAESGPPD